MRQQLDITGDRFGRLVAHWPVGVRQYTSGRKIFWLCVCDCGNTTLASTSDLRAMKGKRKNSCGCLLAEYRSERLPEMLKSLPAKTHGHWVGGIASPEWRSWVCMRQRCYYERNKDYRNYGGRGITVCDRWRDSFENFLKDMGSRPEGKTLDRFPNPDGNYEPSNCRWATPKEQRANWSKQ